MNKNAFEFFKDNNMIEFFTKLEKLNFDEANEYLGALGFDDNTKALFMLSSEMSLKMTNNKMLYGTYDVIKVIDEASDRLKKILPNLDMDILKNNIIDSMVEGL